MVNNLSLLGYSKLQILSFLGKPNSSEIIEEDKLLYLEYKIQDTEDKQKKLLSIYFDKDNLVKMTLMHTPIDL
ncbi:outer membrane protein assembly factor BamE [Flavobacterium sp. CYK-4]|uniref:outer membrane protein assembly factor BamE domain-containing protein n=1 Tax=Flavobacterium lotistagni TaxID=2709660 RepID=UPI00140B1E70|nr:outer membrane protein assembly factor BamE [Flavobacterium lotistagni]